MCQAATEGGLRCATHARPAYAAARIGTPEWDTAAAAYAATPTGREELIGSLHETRDRDHALLYHLALHRGRVMREAADQVRTQARDGVHVTAGEGADHTYTSRTGSMFSCHSLTNLRRDAARARPARTLTADISGRIRGGYVEAPNTGAVTGTIRVTHNGQGQGFTVTADERSLQCNCVDYQANYDCEHVRNLLSEVNQRINQERMGPRHAGAVLESRREAIYAALDRDSILDIGPHEVSYSDPAAWDEALRSAERLEHAGTDIYLRENALGGLGDPDTGRGFGIEIEFVGGDRAAIGRDLHAAGLTSSPHMAHYGAGRSDVSFGHDGGWRYEADMTVDGEIISPVMFDTPETWDNLERVTEIVRRHGGRVDHRAGMHVHVSTADMRHDPQAYGRLVDMFNDHEDVLYRVAATPGEQHRYARGSNWCAPNRQINTNFRQVSDVWSAGLSTHEHALNFQSVGGRRGDNVEFRVWDATLNPGAMQAQIAMSVAMTEAARRETTYQPTGRLHFGTNMQGGTPSPNEHDPARRLADLLFRRQVDKQRFTDVYATGLWQSR